MNNSDSLNRRVSNPCPKPSNAFYPKNISVHSNLPLYPKSLLEKKSLNSSKFRKKVDSSSGSHDERENNLSSDSISSSSSPSGIISHAQSISFGDDIMTTQKQTKQLPHLNIRLPQLKIPQKDGSLLTVPSSWRVKTEDESYSDSSSSRPFRCLLLNPTCSLNPEPHENKLWKQQDKDIIEDTLRSKKELLNILVDPEKQNTVFKKKFQSIIQLLSASKLWHSLKGKKPMIQNINQDFMFVVPIPTSYVNDVSCYGLCDGHGMKGHVIASFISHFMKGAFAFVIELYISFLNEKNSVSSNVSTDSKTSDLILFSSINPSSPAVSCLKNDCDDTKKTLLKASSLFLATSGAEISAEQQVFQQGFETARKVLEEKCTCTMSEKSVLFERHQMEQILLNIVESLEKEIETFPESQTSGSTLSVILRLGPDLWVLWVGDSKIIGFEYQWSLDEIDDSESKYCVPNDLFSKENLSYMNHFPGVINYKVNETNNNVSPNLSIQFRSLFESNDHCPGVEKKRIIQAGGSVSYTATRLQRPTYRLQPTGIAMSRSIGDVVSASYGLTHIPEIICLPVPWRNEETSWNWAFVLASDGLWDTSSIEEIAKDLIAKTLTQLFHACFSFDAEQITDEDNQSVVDIWSPAYRFYLSYFVESIGKEHILQINEEAQRRRLELEGYSDDTSTIVYFVH